MQWMIRCDGGASEYLVIPSGGDSTTLKIFLWKVKSSKLHNEKSIILR